MSVLILAEAGTGEAGMRMWIRATARTSLVLFGAAFTASSLRSLWRTPATGWLLRQRRYLGLSFAFSHGLHLLAILGLSLVLGDAFEIDAVTLIFGGGAYVMIALMAATSSDRVFAWLGRRRWHLLHKVGVYWIWIIFANSYTARAVMAVARGTESLPTCRSPSSSGPCSACGSRPGPGRAERIANQQSRQLADEGRAIQIVDPPQREAVRQALGRLHDQVGGRVRVAKRWPRPAQGLRQRVRQRLLEAKHAGVRGGGMLGLIEEHPVERGAFDVKLDQRLGERAQLRRETPSGRGWLEDREQLRALALELALDHGDQQRVLVGEVFVERADRNPGPLGHAIGGSRLEAALLENPSRGVEDGRDGDLRTPLRGLSDAASVEERLDQVNRMAEKPRGEALEREARKEGELIWYAAMASDRAGELVESLRGQVSIYQSQIPTRWGGTAAGTIVRRTSYEETAGRYYQHAPLLRRRDGKGRRGGAVSDATASVAARRLYRQGGLCQRHLCSAASVSFQHPHGCARQGAAIVRRSARSALER